ISQYYEGASNNKWIELYNATASTIDLTAGDYRLGQWNNTSRELWKSGTAPNSTLVLTGTIAPGGTFLIRHTSAVLPSYANAQMTNGTVMGFNGDDSVVLYTGSTYAVSAIIDSFGL